MGDAADMAQSIIDEHVARGVAAARAHPVGAISAGDCDNCGDAFLRLVDGLCGYCRDGRRPLIERISPDAPASTGGVFPRPTEETDVSPKSIQLPATAQTAILAVERLAKTEILSLGAAAAKLIERGLATDSVPRDAPMPLAIGDVHIDALFDEIRRRCDADEEEADAALGAAVARAEAAEATVAQIRATLGQPG